MQLHLYRPQLWWRAGEIMPIFHADIDEFEAWRLVKSGYASFYSPSYLSSHGDIMTDDVSAASQLITPPASEPVSLAQAKAFLRIEHTADDDAITRAIVAARQFAEHYLRLVLLPQTWNYAAANIRACRVWLPIGPAQTITSITLTDISGNATVMSAVNYRLAVDGFSVLLNNLPTAERIDVRYTASRYATVNNISSPIIQGMLHHISAMMEMRDGAAPVPVQSIHCYQPYRRVMV